MFDFDVGKLIVIGIVALIVIGPKDLPRVLRQVGQAVGKMKRMASEFQGQFMDAMREADVDNLKKDMEKAVALDGFDPLKDVRGQLDAVNSDVTAALAEAPADPHPAEPANSILAGHAEEPGLASTHPDTQNPHPEEPQSGVSKDGVAPEHAPPAEISTVTSFETRPAGAPQDEGIVDAGSHAAAAAPDKADKPA